MIVKKATIQLLVIFTIAGNFCFGQEYGNPFPVFDTAEIKYLSQASTTYYKNNIIACRLYHDAASKKIHYEFIRLAKDRYYCTEYDSSGILINEGVAVKEAVPYEFLKTPFYDSQGNITGVKKYPFYKLVRDEEWIERTNVTSSMHGKYSAGKKEGLWTEIKNKDDVEYKLYYKSGMLIKTEKINLANTGDPRIAALLVNKWIVTELSKTATQKFYPGEKLKNSRSQWYIELLKNGDCKMFSGGGHHSAGSVKTGKWETNQNFTVLKLIFTDKTLKASIDYISTYGLILSFE